MAPGRNEREGVCQLLCGLAGCRWDFRETPEWVPEMMKGLGEERRERCFGI